MLWGCFDGKLPLKSTFEEKLYARCFGANGRSEKCLKTGPINLTEMLFSRWFSWELQYEMFWSFLKQKCQTIAVSVRNVLLLFVHNWSSFYAHQRQTFSCLKQVNCDLQSCCKPWHCFGWLPVSLAVSDPSILATSPHRVAKITGYGSKREDSALFCSTFSVTTETWVQTLYYCEVNNFWNTELFNTFSEMKVY